METKETKAIAKAIRITPRKCRLVADLVRGKNIKEAQNILKFVNKSASPVILKVVNSAAANAVNNDKLDGDKLFIKSIHIGEGQRMKRFMPRAKGSASSIIKRTSHITVVVAER
jgi:large subunit ribosomal protein L22